MYSLSCALLLTLWYISTTDSAAYYNYPNIKDDVFQQQVNLMNPKKVPHDKNQQPIVSESDEYFAKFKNFLNDVNDAADPKSPEHNRIKRRAKKGKRGKDAATTSKSGLRHKTGSMRNKTKSVDPVEWDRQRRIRTRVKGDKDLRHKGYETYDPMSKSQSGYIEVPKDLYQAHLRPGVILRIHMAEAITKMQYRNYELDQDASIVEADVEYLRLTRKVISDEITKFEDYLWLMDWFGNRTDLIQEHVCNSRYYTVGIPPTLFTHQEEYMKRACLFDSVYLDHIPYVIGEDRSLMAAVAPPVLHCDAATCTSVPFIDSLMFDEHLPRSNVRTITRCQASCRAHCRNDPDCLKRCSDRCQID